MTQTSKVIELAQLCLRFGRVDRATTHEDGQRRETDTDHTVMLGVIACAFASSCGLDLDIGKVAQFALVHDLVEAYAGDTNTLLSGEDASKAAREAEAFGRIDKDFAESLPWLPKTIAAYEQLDTREARYVKALDKVLPKITHILNRGAMLGRHGVDANNIDAVNGSQVLKMLASYARDQHEVMLLYADVHAELKRILVEEMARWSGNGSCGDTTDEDNDASS
jgi:5'-deoxynucleotidase YfbR-like HD superfamily hydrolase